jgi:hypothetical protein
MAGENMDWAKAEGWSVVALAGVGTTTSVVLIQAPLCLNNINLDGGKK